MSWINSVSLIIEPGERRGRRTLRRAGPLSSWDFDPAHPHRQREIPAYRQWPVEQQMRASRAICLVGIGKVRVNRGLQSSSIASAARWRGTES
jgi:hypothetical protein